MAKQVSVCFNPMCRLHQFLVDEGTKHFYIPNKETNSNIQIERVDITIASRKGNCTPLVLCESCANITKIYDELVKGE